jgi:hypothetical protein
MYYIVTLLYNKVEEKMGYRTKIQKVDRPTNQTFYVNLPTALAQSLEIKKGEEFDWIIENKNLLLLQRIVPVKQQKLKKG